MPSEEFVVFEEGVVPHAIALIREPSNERRDPLPLVV
jgi:hypothetical protein